MTAPIRSELAKIVDDTAIFCAVVGGIGAFLPAVDMLIVGIAWLVMTCRVIAASKSRFGLVLVGKLALYIFAAVAPLTGFLILLEFLTTGLHFTPPILGSIISVAIGAVGNYILTKGVGGAGVRLFGKQHIDVQDILLAIWDWIKRRVLGHHGGHHGHGTADRES
jgi:hypothetical protein